VLFIYKTEEEGARRNVRGIAGYGNVDPSRGWPGLAVLLVVFASGLMIIIQPL
jgi:hypothetical protein